MTNFMRSDDYTAKTSSIFDNSDGVDFLQSLVDDTSSTNIRKS